MKKLSNLILLLCFLSSSIILLPLPSFAIEDAIVAVVEDEVITLKDLKDYIQSVYTRLKMEQKYSDSQLQKIMASVEKEGIDRLIDDRIILNAANEHGIEAKRQAIDKKIEELKQKYPSEQAFIASLTMDGFTISDLRKQISKQLKSQFFVDTEIKSTIKVKPQEVTNFYNENKSNFKYPERANINSLFIPFGANTDAETLTLAEQIRTNIMGGSSFSKEGERIAASASTTIISRGQMKAEIEKEIFSLSPEEISNPIKTDQGYFLFKLNFILPEEIASLEKSKNKIVQFLFNKKFQEKLASWLKEEKKKLYIEIKTP